MGKLRKIQTMGKKQKQNKSNLSLKKNEHFSLFSMQSPWSSFIIVLFFSCNVYKGGKGTVRRIVGKTMSVMLRLTVSQCQANVHTEYSGNALPMFARGPRRPRGSERSGLVAPSPFYKFSCATICPRPRVCVSEFQSVALARMPWKRSFEERHAVQLTCKARRLTD